MDAPRLSIQTTFSRNLRRAREQRGFSQAELAERAELSASHMNDLEQGRKWVSSDSMERLAEALGLEPYMLLLPVSYGGERDPFMLLSEYAETIRAQLGGTIDASIRDFFSRNVAPGTRSQNDPPAQGARADHPAETDGPNTSR
jgi:transcriptional regulator with XRE-family HTH domain